MSSLDKLKKELDRKGASSAQKNSTVVRMIAELIDDGRIDGLEDPREAAERLWWLVGKATDCSISDRQLKEGVNVYSTILERTKEIVDSDMTEAIWIKTIEAASYGTWRAIMGPKFEDKARRI